MKDFLQVEAKQFVAMARCYAGGKRYKAGWVKRIYDVRYPNKPLSTVDFENSGIIKPNQEFKNWVRSYHAQGLKAAEYKPSKRFLANQEFYNK